MFVETVVRVPVVCSDLFVLIDWFYWYKIYFKLYFKPLLIIVDLCVSYSLDQSSFILNFFLGCVRKLSVVRIQTGHTGLLSLQICWRLFWGCQFFNFTCSNQYIDWLQGGFPILLLEIDIATSQKTVPFVVVLDKRRHKGHQGLLGSSLANFWWIVGNWYMNLT